MPLKIWNGSSWTEATRLKVWDGSSWVDSTYGKVWNGSAWVEFYQGFRATLTADSYLRSSSTPASFQVNNDGFIYASGGTTQLIQRYKWLTGIGTGADYEVLASIVNGSVSGDSLSVWLPLSSNRQWNRGALSGQLQSATISVQIRMAASPNTVLAGPVNIDIECDRS